MDVFADAPFHGNPAAVFFDANVYRSEFMQKIANELNLLEAVPEFDEGFVSQKADLPIYEYKPSPTFYHKLEERPLHQLFVDRMG